MLSYFIGPGNRSRCWVDNPDYVKRHDTFHEKLPVGRTIRPSSSECRWHGKRRECRIVVCAIH